VTMTDMEDDDGLMTMEEVMTLLKCKRTKVYSLGAEGRLQLRKFDRNIRITRASVARLLHEIKSNPKSQERSAKKVPKA